MTMSNAQHVAISELFQTKTGFADRLPLVKSTSLPLAAEDLYQKGLCEGQMLAEAAFSVERERLQRLITSANALRHEDNPEILEVLNQVVATIVRQIVGSSGFDHDFMIGQIKTAAALLVEADQARSICLHPDDFELLENTDLPLRCKADTSVPPGGVKIECSAGWIEHGPAYTLRRIEEALGIGTAG